MLTDVDVHYLVGLLTQVSETKDVDIELGSMVYDSAAEKNRDVDITIKYKGNDGADYAFSAIEVKDHSKASRKMGVQEVEGLCTKLRDMPQVTHKGIVSSTGYTNGAKNKAKFHGVELFELLPWNDLMIGFDHVKFANGSPISERQVAWKDKVDLVLTPIDPKIIFKIEDVSKICDRFGKPLENCSNISTLREKLMAIGLNANAQTIPNNGEKDINIGIEIADDLFFEVNGKLVQIKFAQVKGVAICKETQLKPEFKILKKVEEDKPYVGCIITEFSNGSLMGFAIANNHRDIKLISIPLSDRTKKKIYKQRLSSN